MQTEAVWYFSPSSQTARMSAQVVLGGNDSYIAMCHKCYVRGIREKRVIKLHGQN